MQAKYMIIMSTLSKDRYSNSPGKAEILYTADISDETLEACVSLGSGHYSKDTLVIIELGTEYAISSEVQVEIEKKAKAKAEYNAKMALEIEESLVKHRDSIEEPYLIDQSKKNCSCGCVDTEERNGVYNPAYGDNRICTCGHPYSRHFDSHENNEAVGCKYCGCYTFKEAKSVTELKEKKYY